MIQRMSIDDLSKQLGVQAPAQTQAPVEPVVAPEQSQEKPGFFDAVSDGFSAGVEMNKSMKEEGLIHPLKTPVSYLMQGATPVVGAAAGGLNHVIQNPVDTAKEVGTAIAENPVQTVAGIGTSAFLAYRGTVSTPFMALAASASGGAQVLGRWADSAIDAMTSDWQFSLHGKEFDLSVLGNDIKPGDGFKEYATSFFSGAMPEVLTRVPFIRRMIGGVAKQASEGAITKEQAKQAIQESLTGKVSEESKEILLNSNIALEKIGVATGVQDFVEGSTNSFDIVQKQLDVELLEVQKYFGTKGANFSEKIMYGKYSQDKASSAMAQVHAGQAQRASKALKANVKGADTVAAGDKVLKVTGNAFQNISNRSAQALETLRQPDIANLSIPISRQKLQQVIQNIRMSGVGESGEETIQKLDALLSRKSTLFTGASTDNVTVSVLDMRNLLADIDTQVGAFAQNKGQKAIAGVLKGPDIGTSNQLEQMMYESLENAAQYGNTKASVALGALTDRRVTTNLMSEMSRHPFGKMIGLGTPDGNQLKSVAGSIMSDAQSLDDFVDFGKRFSTHGEFEAVMQDMGDAIKTNIHDQIFKSTAKSVQAKGSEGIDTKIIDDILSRKGGKSPEAHLKSLGKVVGEDYVQRMLAVKTLADAQAAAIKNTPKLGTLLNTIRTNMNADGITTFLATAVNPKMLLADLNRFALGQKEFTTLTMKRMLAKDLSPEELIAMSVDPMGPQGRSAKLAFINAMLKTGAVHGQAAMFANEQAKALEGMSDAEYQRRIRMVQPTSVRSESGISRMSKQDLADALGIEVPNMKGPEDGSTIDSSPIPADGYTGGSSLGKPGKAPSPQEELTNDIQSGVQPGLQEESSKFADHIIAEEGFRDTAYRGVLGKRTVGIGFNMDQDGAKEIWSESGVSADFDEVYSGKASITKEEAKSLAQWFLKENKDDIVRLVPGFDELSPNRKSVLVDMIYQLGPSAFGKFKNTLAAINRGDFQSAFNSLKKARLFKQTPNRVLRNGIMLVHDVGHKEAEEMLISQGKIKQYERVTT